MRTCSSISSLINTVASARWGTERSFFDRFNGLSRLSEAVETAKTGCRLQFHRAKAAVLMRGGDQRFGSTPVL